MEMNIVSQTPDVVKNQEALGNYEFDKIIKSNDRVTSFEIMANIDGYSIGTGIMTDSVALQDGFVTRQLIS